MATGAWITWRLITRLGGAGAGGGPATVIPGAITIDSGSTITVTGTSVTHFVTPGAITVNSDSTIAVTSVNIPTRQLDLLDASPCDNKIDSQNQVVVPSNFGITPMIVPTIQPPTLQTIPNFNIPYVSQPKINIGATTININSGSVNTGLTSQANLFDYLNSERYRDWLFQYFFSKMPLIFSYDGVLSTSESPPYNVIRDVNYTYYTIQSRIAAGSSFLLYANVIAPDGTMILTYNLYCDGTTSYTAAQNLPLKAGQVLYISCQATTTATDVTVTFYNP